MAALADKIAANLADVRQRIDNAARKAGRNPSEITLVAVTKYADVQAVRMLVQAGCLDLGESRPQELWSKATALNDLNIRWHQVGHLQTNKLAKTLPLIHRLHSIDSRHLLESTDHQSGRLGLLTHFLIEVNISGDRSKHGFPPAAVAPIVRDVAQFANVRLHGLMTMASLEGGIDRARRDFAQLRLLRDSLRPDCPAEASLDELSMGMSADFEVAIAEGATMVRIGTALFE
jgi:pyridoxal phosphate enzyme (YggS family)